MDRFKIQGLLDLVSKDHTIISDIFIIIMSFTILFLYNFISNRDHASTGQRSYQLFSCQKRISYPRLLYKFYFFITSVSSPL